MARIKIVNGKSVPLTAEEETQRDAEEAAWAAGASLRLKQVLAAKRYDREIAGTTWNGWPVSTTIESRGRLLGAYNAAKEGRWANTDGWKFADGIFRALTAAQMQALYLAVEAYVKACFAAEGQKAAEIDSTGTTNLETGWPT